MHKPSCIEHCPDEKHGGFGTSLIWAPFWVIGAALAVAIIIRTAEIIWPYVVTVAAVGGSFYAGILLHRVRRHRRRLARMIPAPDLRDLLDAPVRTVAQVVGRHALPGMAKAPAPMQERAQ
jgi:hypothetical protein